MSSLGGYGGFFNKRRLVENTAEVVVDVVQPITHYFIGPQKEIPQKFVDALRSEHSEFMSKVLMGKPTSVLALFLENTFKQPTIIRDTAQEFINSYKDILNTIKAVLDNFKAEHEGDKKLCNEAQRVFDGMSKCFQNIHEQFDTLNQKFNLQVKGLQNNSAVEVEPRVGMRVPG